MEKSVAPKIVRNIFIYIFLVICAFLVLAPFIYMLFVSFKDGEGFVKEKVVEFYYSSPTFNNYKNAFEVTVNSNLARSLVNSLVFSLLSTAFMIIVAVLAAYAFSRFRFKGREILFTFFLLLMMIPNELVIIANYATIYQTGFTNTFVGLILPTTLSSLATFLIRGSFMSVPDFVYYQAKVDGASDFWYLKKVLIPNAKPVILSVFLLKLIECFNLYIWPSLVADDVNYSLVSTAMSGLRGASVDSTSMPVLMAAAFVVILPTIIFYLIFRKKIIASVKKVGNRR